eukprot:SAG25_NODE_317_length_9961_cov_5.088724_8_plen_77_part_00
MRLSTMMTRTQFRNILSIYLSKPISMKRSQRARLATLEAVQSFLPEMSSGDPVCISCKPETWIGPIHVVPDSCLCN